MTHISYLQIVSSLSPLVHSIPSKGNECFITSSRFLPHTTDNSIVWCIGWQKNHGSELTILGGLQTSPFIYCFS
ncbi:hypothetical protein BHE74_00051033 [Ensete ventricosum]|nr:hypothetical protein GW17_00006970 [Ensete ventricosum]RWW43325.1 hypothetical protein BHE74_00051033 [Ensete ventricosum]RZR99745.1 hypothetical protein BHM03_00029352 [Ensete ventricosum]